MTLVLITATAIALYLCYLIAYPFLSSMVWALALAVIVFPLYRRLNIYIKHDNLAAGIMTILVAAVVVVPFVFVGRQVARELWRNIENVQAQIESGEWRRQLEQYPQAARALDWLGEEVEMKDAAEQTADRIPGILSSFFSGSLWFLFQLIIMFFALFFFFRDHDVILRGIRSVLPLSRRETNTIFKRAEDTLYAAVFAELLIALVQGVLGGAMFWILGLPAPVLWGFVMGLFGFLPVIGAWSVWMPVSIYLFLQGEWIKGLVLLIWGLVIVNLLTTFLYPVLVGDRLRLHTLLVFVAIIGGIIAFGMVGIILGPLVLALTISLLDIWKRRLDRDEEENGSLSEA